MNNLEKMPDIDFNPEKFNRALERLQKYQITKTEDDPEDQEGWIYDLPKDKDKRLEVGDHNYYDFAVRGNFANVFLLELGLLIEKIPNTEINQENKKKLKDLEYELRTIYQQIDGEGNRTMRTREEMKRVKEIVDETLALSHRIVFESAVVAG